MRNRYGRLRSIWFEYGFLLKDFESQLNKMNKFKMFFIICMVFYFWRFWDYVFVGFI